MVKHLYHKVIRKRNMRMHACVSFAFVFVSKRKKGRKLPFLHQFRIAYSFRMKNLFPMLISLPSLLQTSLHRSR